MWKTEMMKTMKTKDLNQIMSVLYLGLGYGFIYLWSSWTPEWGLTLFTAAYVTAVLGYCYGSGRKPARESWFWLTVLFAIAIPMNFYLTFGILQILALMMAAAYWTESVGGSLLDHGKTSHFIAFDLWNVFVQVPFRNFSAQIRVWFPEKENGQEEGTEQKKMKMSGVMAVVCGLVLVIPVLCMILPLLSRADAGFARATEEITEYLQWHLAAVLMRLLFAIPVSLYLFGLVYGSIYKVHTDDIKVEQLRKMSVQVKRLPQVTVCTVLLVICGVYGFFMGIQGNYLFSAIAGRLPETFTYAEYARRGFFELCQIGIWTLGILLLANMFAGQTAKALKCCNILLAGETLLLLITAASKMFLYIRSYGLTINRILPMVFMIWMGMVLISFVLRQRKRFPMVRICVLAGAVLFCMLCVLPVQHLTELYNTWARMSGLIP